jgi:hypothetical protein
MVRWMPQVRTTAKPELLPEKGSTASARKFPRRGGEPPPGKAPWMRSLGAGAHRASGKTRDGVHFRWSPMADAHHHHVPGHAIPRPALACLSITTSGQWAVEQCAGYGGV